MQIRQTLSGSIFKTILLIGIFMVAIKVQAQWTVSGSNIYFNGGNVGIGTSNPAQRLTVQGGGIGFDGNASDKKLFASTDGVLEWFTHDLAADHGFAVSHQGTKRVFLNTNGNSYLIGGNFGIGTMSPNEKLSVAGNISLTGTIPTVSMTERTILQMPMVAENNYTRSAYAQNIQWNDGVKKWKIIDQTYSDFSLIKLESNGTIGFFTKPGNGATADLTNAQLDNYRKLTIETNGNVGIGTADPKTKLDVNGIFQTYNKDSQGAYWDNLQIWSDGNGSYIQANGDDNGLRLKSNSGGKILLESNVGIGTDNTHGYKLAVNGNALFTKVIVKEYINWPDYVFADNYKLMPLKELYSFIRQHKHLPEVPSASDIAKNGIDVGESQAILLKKIEELTLYIIALEEKLDRLSKIVDTVRKN